MLRMLSAITMLSASAALAFSEMPDSTGRAMGLDSLARKIDSLEAGLVKLKMEKQDHEIYAIGDALDWGKGFGTAFRFSESGYGLEVNYTFPSLGFDKPYYLGNYRSIGLGLGFDEYVNDNPMRRTLSDSTFSPLFVPYASLRLTSPVLLNFTSFSAAFRLFWTKPEATAVPGWGMTEEMQFWLTRAGHINLGMKVDLDPRLSEGERPKVAFQPYFGMAFSFGKKGNLNMRPAK